jgi:hypothetical protein
MADNFDIGSWKSNFGSGARSYLFLWEPQWPDGVETTSFGEGSVSARYLVRSTNFPGDNVEEIIVNWQGSDLKLPGKRTMGDWTVTLNVDKPVNVRRAFDEWMKIVHNPETGVYGKYDKDNRDYVADQYLAMLDYEGNEIRVITLTDAWIKSLGTIELDYANQDVAQFDVTFGYMHHSISKTLPSN